MTEIYAPLSLNQFTQAPLQGQTAYGYVPQKISAIISPSSESVASIVPGSAVKLVGQDGAGGVIVDLAGDTDQVFGFVMWLTSKNTYSAGGAIDIAFSTNFMYMTAGEDLTAGDSVQIHSADTTVNIADGTGEVIGQVMENAASGDLAIIFITTPDLSYPSLLASKSEFIGLKNVINYSAGTWTTTRIAGGNYAAVKTAAADTTIIGIDITPQITEAANKGFKLTSINVISSIGTLALNAHSLVLDKVVYANNVAVSVSSVALTGSLPTATQANPYVSNLAVSSPVYDNTDNSKYVAELTVNAQSTSTYSFYGLVLEFTQAI